MSIAESAAEKSLAGKLAKITTVVAMGSLLVAGSISPAAAFVGSRTALGQSPAADGGTVNVTDVRFRGRGFSGRGFGGGRHFGINRGVRGGFRGRSYGYRGGYGRGIGIGVGALAAGALIGGALAASQAAPVDDAVSYCASRFRSYDPSTGTYTGYDGQPHACP